MKKIAIALFAVIALTSCGGGASTEETSTTDSTACCVKADSCVKACVDSAKVDTTAKQ